ncbi:uncharacterized protein J8A68_003110 [[Candida] subhashii]|uniref:GLC7-interacting protein 3 n=1 Tax=[Candida] subhashii TaxID=561895 RepID=A0A8J5UN03_9ASCO|nr:uncharacterized protein J8A68_003110 [[Candida] subhashii]KAG7663362.1 hypothetical protein J8A68_003110 [[Candida] subhashii]
MVETKPPSKETINHGEQSKSPLPANNDKIETGVTNVDVDWLFRGKSKKLIKKMNSTSNRSENPVVPSKEAEKKDEDKETKPKSEEIISNESTKLDTNTQKDTTVKPEEKKATTPTSTMISPVATTKPTSSKLDKLKVGRSRSSSASAGTTKAESTNQSEKRRSSFNFITPSLTSDLVYNDHDAEMRSYMSGTGSAIPTPSQTSSPAVSRSNSGKRGLFSSLSSKFKSSSSTASTPASGQHHHHHHHHHVPHQPQKTLNPNLLGEGQTKPQGDLASTVNKPPAEIAIPTKRKNSLTPKSGSIPIFKESYLNKEETLSSSPSSSDGLRFFRRRSSNASSISSAPTVVTTRMILNKNPNREKVPIKCLDDVKLRRVNFAIDKLEFDPQQQIPSRRPRRGNVLIPQDIAAPIPRLCLGISVNEANKEAGSQGQLQQTQYTEREIAMAVEAQKRALAESNRHALEAHTQAMKIASEVATFKPSKFSIIKENESSYDTEDDIDMYTKASKKLAHDAAIDQPLHVHEQHFKDSSPESMQDAKGEITLEAIYTRCCHLREILPIPATLKQLKNKTAPLQVLKMLNPKPTLIDVLSFSDFIAITPINTVIFDNVTMTTEMFRHFLSSLCHNRALEKLSLRNVAIDETGWKILCKFLAKNKTIKKLDISQQRIKSDTKETCIRANMNWDLFIESIVLRGGIEELVINGCKLSDEIFEKLINNAVKQSTYRLGIAGIDLNVAKAEVVANWLTDKNSKCVGVDIASNDLSQGQLQPFIRAFNEGVENLVFFSVNGTQLSNIEEATQLIQSLINVKTLRFLDLSSLPQLFPGIITKLAKYLPQYPSLRRIHFDLNELSPKAIGSIATFLSKMPKLVHVSLLGNRNLTHTACFTIYSAVKSSHSIFALDLDYDLVSEDLSSRMAFYLMRNMDISLKPEYMPHARPDNEEEIMFDGSLLMETAEKLLSEFDSSQKEDRKIQQIIANTIVEKTRTLRKDIHATIDALFQKRNKGELSFDGKENLVRFCLLDASLEKLVHMFEEHDYSKLTPTTSRDQIIEENNSSATSMFRIPSITVDQMNLHESSRELLTTGPILSPHNSVAMNNTQNCYFESTATIDQNLLPHQVVVENSENGQSFPVDKLTGRPVLIRNSSQTSLHAKEQELEEGDFHRLGVFMQSRNDPEERKPNLPLLSALPSGPELRDAIINAKGIKNVTDLISKINDNRITIDNLIPPVKKEEDHDGEEDEGRTVSSNENGSVHSKEDVNPMVDEIYDKLLNDAQRAHLTK